MAQTGNSARADEPMAAAGIAVRGQVRSRSGRQVGGRWVHVDFCAEARECGVSRGIVRTDEAMPEVTWPPSHLESSWRILGVASRRVLQGVAG